MNSLTPYLLACMMASGIAVSAMAADAPAGLSAAAAPGPLSPEQLRAIRGISRNVVAAHNSQTEAGGDEKQLESLRKDIDALIRAESEETRENPEIQAQAAQVDGKPAGATPQGAELANTPQTPQINAGRHAPSARVRGERAKAREWAGKLRGRADSMAQVNESDTAKPVAAIQARRAKLFREWSDTLETSTDATKPDRIAKLEQLRDLMKLSRIAPSEQHYHNDTPTMMAVQANDVVASDVVASDTEATNTEAVKPATPKRTRPSKRRGQ
ncbi:MAG: hypothetical protein Q8O79_03455 [Pseudomonadota bacterium]|nr:hypothetical protein [Pseudomonadota bacterium]